jgi:high-affinity iron transporter
MKKITALLRALALVALAATLAFGAPGASAGKKVSGALLIEETGSYLNEALACYKKGDFPGAKAKAQAAYFETYENLEGLIRVNVSAKKNIELEDDFIEIRKMIVARAPAAQLEKCISDFMVKLRGVAPELASGIELVGETSGPEKQAAPAQGAAAVKTRVEPAWRQASEGINQGLQHALELFKKGDTKGGGDQVVQTQFDAYKSSLLSTAVRRFVSPQRDFEYNSDFSEIAAQMRGGAPVAQVERRVAELLQSLTADLPALALVDGAVAKPESADSAPGKAPEKDWARITGELLKEVDRALELYRTGSTQGAITAVQDAYFDIFELSGMEAKIGARDANFKAKLEAHFSQLVSQMKHGAPAAELLATQGAMKADFTAAAQLLGKGSDSPKALFLYSLMIIVREGFEAILVITAIIAYLVKSGNAAKLKVIYNAVASALVLSVITAVLVKWVFKSSAASQELTEGGTMLLASAVLFSVSYWIISKAEAQKWSAYLKEKVGNSLSSNSLKGLWFAAFLAVYREGAETVLFYQALSADAAGTGLGAVAGGFVTGCLLLVVIYLVMRYGAVKLPIRPFFLATGALLYYLSFVFAGKGVMELVEGKLFVPSPVAGMPTLPAFGIYPYLQTLLPQLVIVLAALAALYLLGRKRPQQPVTD